MGGQKENNVNIIITPLGTIGLFECDSRPALSFVLVWRNPAIKKILTVRGGVRGRVEPGRPLPLPHHRQQDQQGPRHPQCGREEA